jgi:hypothetical protein
MILRLDASQAPFMINDLEKQVSSDFEINYNGIIANISIGGIIDRIDSSEVIFRIIDYKTGGIEMDIGSVGSLFDESNPSRNDAWFQILMYCELFKQENPGFKVRPSMYAVRNMSDFDFSDKMILRESDGAKTAVNDYTSVRDSYLIFLKETFQKIFDKNEPFLMTAHIRKCETCPYRQLCQR